MATPPTALKLGPSDVGREVSSEEFAAAELRRPWKYERARGRLVVMAPDGEAHDDRSEPVRDYLGAYRLSHPEVVDRVVSEAWVHVDGETDRIGEIGVYLVGDRSATPRPERVPELMFEIVSPDRASRERDYVEKRSEYHRLGVLEYVIIDRFLERVTVLTHEPGGYVERRLGPDEAYASPLLPGLAIPLAEVF